MSKLNVTSEVQISLTADEALVWLNPISIERMASTAVRFEVEREAGARVDGGAGGSGHARS
jgi:hypothetical protein